MFPLLEPVCIIIYETQLREDGTHPTLTATLFSAVVTNTVGILQIISGVYLIRGVYLLRRFLREHINTTTMVLYASAYVIYLFTTILYYVTFNMDLIYNDGPATISFLQHAEEISIWTNFISQLLLCAIFWDLGRKNEEEQIVETESTYVEVEVQTYTESDDLQARIWNSYLRDKYAGNPLYVTRSSYSNKSQSQNQSRLLDEDEAPTIRSTYSSETTVQDAAGRQEE